MSPERPALHAHPDDVADALHGALARHVATGEPPGLAWAVGLGGELRTGALGHLDDGRDRPVRPDTIFRISSLTKPVTAAGALALVEDGVLALDQPVDDVLPELADRQVLRRRDSPVGDTEPARRAVTVEDLLTFRLGLGMDFTAGPTPLDEALTAAGLAVAPPAPQAGPPPAEWMRRLGELPLQYHPGERWLYHTAAQVLGVLVARAAGMPLGEWLRERVFAPLGMTDTGFHVPPDRLDRFGACFAGVDPVTGGHEIYDPPGGQWSDPPVFPGGGDGLVSTVHDYYRFAAMLRGRGATGGVRVLSEESVRAMTANHLTPEQAAAADMGDSGWGLGLGVGPFTEGVGSYGWDGGLGSTWRNDTDRDLVAVLLTNQMWTSPEGSPSCDTFWRVLGECLSGTPL